MWTKFGEKYKFASKWTSWYAEKLNFWIGFKICHSIQKIRYLYRTVRYFSLCIIYELELSLSNACWWYDSASVDCVLSALYWPLITNLIAHDIKINFWSYTVEIFPMCQLTFWTGSYALHAVLFDVGQAFDVDQALMTT